MGLSGSLCSGLQSSVISGKANLRDDPFAGLLAGVGAGDEDGYGELATVGERDEADVVRGRN